jgi:hypothetical protein
LWLMKKPVVTNEVVKGWITDTGPHSPERLALDVPATHTIALLRSTCADVDLIGLGRHKHLDYVEVRRFLTRGHGKFPGHYEETYRLMWARKSTQLEWEGVVGENAEVCGHRRFGLRRIHFHDLDLVSSKMEI